MDEAPPSSVLQVSSRQIGSAEAFRFFAESVQDVFATRPALIGIDEFRLDMKAAHLGGLLLTEIRASGQSFERSRRLIATAGIDHFLLQLYAEGGYSGVVGRADVRVRAGDVCLLDMTRTVDTRAGDFRNITLVLPRAALEAQMGDVDALHGLVLDGREPLTRILAGHMQTLSEQAGLLQPVDAEMVGQATIALLARLVGQRTGPNSAHAAPSNALQRMLRHIDANLHDADLGPAQLADQFGMSRASLYRLFEEAGGVAELIRQRRITGAAIELASQKGRGRRISEVARAWGFADESSFGRAFRAHFGLSPSEARGRSGEIWAKARQNALGSLGGPDLSFWVRTLQASP